MSILLTLSADKTVFSRMSDLDTLIKINLTLYEDFFLWTLLYSWASLIAQLIKNLPAMQETPG